MAASWSTNVSGWQGVDDEPTVGSDNLVKGSDIAIEFNQFKAVSGMRTGGGHLQSNGKWGYTESSKHIIIPIKVNDVVSIKAPITLSCIFGILKSYSHPVDNEYIDYATGESRRLLNFGESTTFTVTSEDAKYLVILVQLNGTNYIIQDLTVNNYGYLKNIFEHISNLEVETSDIKYESLANVNNLNGFSDGQQFDMLVGSNGYVYSGESSHILFGLKKGDVLKIKAGGHPCVFAIVSDYVQAVAGKQPIYASGESRRVVTAGDELELEITASDVKYVIFNVHYQSTSYIPNTVSINGNNICDGVNKQINILQSGGEKLINASAKMFLGHSVTKEPSRKYQLFVCYGQSLSDGSDSLYVSDPVIEGNYMLGNIIGSGTNLVPLQLNSNNQHPIVSCVNSLSVLFRKYAKSEMNYIASSVGAGGKSIAQLSKESRIQQYAQDYDYPIKQAGRYEDYFLACLDNAITAVGAGNVECPAIIYLQGERDYVTDSQAPDPMPGSVDSAYACGGNATMYKSRMMDLKNDMQADIMSKFGQNYKPIFCIYEVSGAFIKNDQMTINMAQIEFAQENDDVFLMPSPYFVPDYGAHLSTNGYRWYGEFLAKALFSILYQNSYWKPILPYQYKIDDSKIIISLENNVGKLQFDVTLVEQSTNNGFAVFINDSYSASNISSVEIDDNHIVITCNQSLTGKKVEVVYGGNKTSGSGNVRDNDVYRAMYTYWDDSNDHGSDGMKTIGYRPDIIGDKYPMYNWLASFYQLVNNPT